jgi:hypothetical protein
MALLHNQCFAEHQGAATYGNYYYWDTCRAIFHGQLARCLSKVSVAQPVPGVQPAQAQNLYRLSGSFGLAKLPNIETAGYPSYNILNESHEMCERPRLSVKWSWSDESSTLSTFFLGVPDHENTRTTSPHRPFVVAKGAASAWITT